MKNFCHIFSYGLLMGAMLMCVSACDPIKVDECVTENEPWRVTERSEQIPFSVEYRPAHPFLAEYHRRVTFASGKHVSLVLDTGGAGDFAVYQLSDHMFYLVDGLQFSFPRTEYCVDVQAEAVYQRGSSTWISLPEGTYDIVGWGGDDVIIKKSKDEYQTIQTTVTLACDLEKKKFIGRVSPYGTVTLGGDEPDLTKE